MILACRWAQKPSIMAEKPRFRRRTVFAKNLGFGVGFGYRNNTRTNALTCYFMVIILCPTTTSALIAIFQVNPAQFSFSPLCSQTESSGISDTVLFMGNTYLPVTQPSASKHWRKEMSPEKCETVNCAIRKNKYWNIAHLLSSVVQLLITERGLKINEGLWLSPDWWFP